MRAFWASKWLDSSLLLAVYVGLVVSVPRIFDAVQLQPDEGYELMKGLLCARGYELYQDIWNDQPPLHTYLLAALFELVGSEVWVARGLAALFGGMLLLSFQWLVSGVSGRAAGNIAAVFLLMSPRWFALSTAVMLEVPAFALGTLAVLLAHRYLQTGSLKVLVLSGVVAALALQMKLTAVLMFPALAVILAQKLTGANDRESRALRWLGSLRVLAIWLFAFAAAMLLVGGVLGHDLGTAYRAHFSQGTRQTLQVFPEFQFRFKYFLDHEEGLIGCLLGLALTIARRDGRRTWPCITLLGTVICVHLVHYPWWQYYYLHLAIPMAWLTGYGVAAFVESFRTWWFTDDRRIGNVAIAGGLAACLVVAAFLTRAVPRLRYDLEYIETRSAVRVDTLVETIRARADKTRWIYAPGHDGVYGFHAGITCPPELAVVAHKRFWAGEMSVQSIIGTIRKYRPEQVLLRVPGMTIDWAEVEPHYLVAFRTNNYVLYCRKQIIKKPD